MFHECLPHLNRGHDYSHCATVLKVEKLLKAHGFRNTSQLLEAVNESSDRLQAFYEAEEHQVGPQEWEV